MMLIVTLFYFIYRFEWFEKMSFVLVTCFLYLLSYLYIRSGCRTSVLFSCHRVWIMFRKASFRLLAIISIIIRNCLPGPGYQHGFFYSLVEGSQQVGERPTAAFPSSHVGISTILMIMAWRGSKKLFACLMPFYMLLCGATVYIQAHYVIDAIVGFFSAFLLYVVVTWMFKKWFAQPMFK